MGPIVIYNHVNIIGSELKLDQQRLNPGHKGLKKQIACYIQHSFHRYDDM